MTQLYRIDKKDWNSDGADILITEWAQHNAKYAQLLKNENITIEELENLQQYGPHSYMLYQFAALYRKNGTNYLWRGRRVPMSVRMRLQNMMETSSNEGTLLLYKTRGNSSSANEHFYPVRMSRNRYAIVLGTTNHLQSWISSNGIDEASWRLWCAEHIVDWELHGTLRNFIIRTQYCYMMDQFINSTMFNELYKETFVEMDERNSSMSCPRAAFCIWQDGEIVRWNNSGQKIHPKI